jgi:hypothetical protein
MKTTPYTTAANVQAKYGRSIADAPGTQINSNAIAPNPT